MDKKKSQPNKMRPQLPSEEKPSDILAHAQLAHQDKDPVYPFDPVQDSRIKSPDKKKKKEKPRS